jgi:peroxiredoxin
MATGATPVRDIFTQCRDMDGSLSERLGAFADASRQRQPAFAEAVDRLVGRLEMSDSGKNAPRVGEPMPEFLLPDDAGRLISLEDILRNGPVALTFHRGHWCPYCRISVNALAQAQRVIAKEGGQIVAIMPEREQFARELKEDARADFPVLIDMDNAYAMSLGLAYWVGEEMKQQILDRGRNLADFHGNEAWLLPIPATFVVGRDGRIATRYIDPDYRKGMAIDDLLGALHSVI